MSAESERERGRERERERQRGEGGVREFRQHAPSFATRSRRSMTSSHVVAARLREATRWLDLADRPLHVVEVHRRCSNFHTRARRLEKWSTDRHPRERVNHSLRLRHFTHSPLPRPPLPLPCIISQLVRQQLHLLRPLHERRGVRRSDQERRRRDDEIQL